VIINVEFRQHGRIFDEQETNRITTARLAQGVTMAARIARTEILQRTPAGVNSRLRGSIQVTNALVDRNVVAKVYSDPSAAQYAMSVEEGARPHFPWDRAIRDIPQSLVDWVQKKIGVANETQARTVAMAVARKIKARGTRGAHMFRLGLEAAEPQIDAIAQRIGAQIVSDLSV